MTGYSTQQPEPIVESAGGYQFRWDIEQIERSVDGEKITEWQYKYANVAKDGITDLPRTYKRTVRQHRLDTLVVTTSTGKGFDADETSQTRMVRALQAAQITGLSETAWTLADNTTAWVTLAEMQEALALAMQAQAAVWFEG
jgi:hypothetical protein